MSQVVKIRLSLLCLFLFSLGAESASLVTCRIAWLEGPWERAFQKCFPEAEQGNAEAQFEIYRMYRDGLGVEKDAKKAWAWLKRSSEGGYHRAQENMGWLYGKGWLTGIDKRVSPDGDVAKKWFRRAIEQHNGHVIGVFNLANKFYYGDIGIDQDYTRARLWFRFAADYGYAEAQFSLGQMESEGEGLPRDYVRAVQWYRKAAVQGHLKAQHNLGVMYAHGNGVPQNFVEAYAWFSMSAAKGLQESAKARDLITDVMTASQIEQGQKRLNELLEEYERQ